jgi:two-component system chemotaxis response regulator CheY
MMSQPRALVIDDSRVARAMVTRALAGLYEISQADCAEAALETLDTLAGSDPFALVVVDWNMPGMTGVEFVRQLRMSDSYADVKILMITTEVETQGVITALEAGVDEYLMKPFSRAAVLEKLALLGLPCDEFGTTSVD